MQLEKNTDYKKLLDCALGIAIRLLQNGAEISRVEETVTHICMAYGAESVDVFAIPTKIEATLETKDEWFTTKMRRIYDQSLNIGRIEDLNRMSRDICNTTPDVKDIYKMIRDFDKARDPKWMIYLKCFAAFIGCGAFAIMYGGNIVDGLASGIVSLIMAILLFTIGSIGHYKIFNTLVLSIVGGFLSVAFYYMHIGDHISYIMIGAVMLLIPGKEFGIAFRELMMRDLISGAIRIFQSIIITLAIVIGFSIPIALFNYNMDFYSFHNAIITITMAIIGGVSFSIIFGVKLKRLIYIAVGAFVVTGVYVLMDHYYDSLLANIFVAQLAGALYSELVAKIFKMPTIVCLLTTNLALVPGGLLYYTIYALWNNQVGAKGYLLDVIYSSFGIGAGILVISIIFNTIYRTLAYRKMECNK